MYGAFAHTATPEDVTRCIKAVWDGYYSYQCSRKRGHGPRGLYCKQHGKKADDDRARRKMR